MPHRQLTTMNPTKPFGGTLQGWTLSSIFDNHQQITALIFDHPSGLWADGEEITTTHILHIDYKERIAETWNMIYELGLPKDEFAKVRDTVVDMMKKRQSTDM